METGVLKDFEAYCSVIIEIEKFKKYYLGRMSDSMKQISISSVRSAVEDSLKGETEPYTLILKKKILERLLKEYELYLYS